ncbi:hypothetical protein DVG78_03080 [Runella aurantiaca]|uniref:Uncharacterized protein n=1 Tax=Runella aurantiaca TaxID=2282308 RepID=A0A369ILD3_9BACT|nr:hypothetical protein DVG78_03080 [Runella aurantiaca]
MNPQKGWSQNFEATLFYQNEGILNVFFDFSENEVVSNLQAGFKKPASRVSAVSQTPHEQ